MTAPSTGLRSGSARVDSTDDRPGGRPGIASRLGGLFEPAPRRRIGWRRVVVGAAAVCVAAAVSLGRVGGPGAFNSIWAEDASNFLTGALTQHARSTIFEPVNGYFLLVPRLLAEFASLFPLAAAPGVLSAAAALVTAGMGLLCYVASRGTLRHRTARIVVAGGIVAAPVGENHFTNVLNSVAPLQFPMLFALFWCVLWTPNRRPARTLQVIVVLACALSTILAVAYVPLAALRVAVRRDRLSVALLAGLLAGVAAQAYGLLAGVSSRGDISNPRIDPIWALRSFATWAMPLGLFGPEGVRGTDTTGLTFTGSGSGTPYVLAVVGAWTLVAAAVALGAFRLTRPAWLLAGVAGGHAVGVLAMEIIVQGSLVLRYVFPSSLLVVTALVAILLPRPDVPPPRAMAPLLGLTLIVAVAALANYRLETLRTQSAPWDVKLAQARAYCAEHPYGEARLHLSRSAPWHVRIPCHRLR